MKEYPCYSQEFSLKRVLIATNYYLQALALGGPKYNVVISTESYSLSLLEQSLSAKCQGGEQYLLDTSVADMTT